MEFVSLFQRFQFIISAWWSSVDTAFCQLEMHWSQCTEKDTLLHSGQMSSGETTQISPFIKIQFPIQYKIIVISTINESKWKSATCMKETYLIRQIFNDAHCGEK